MQPTFRLVLILFQLESLIFFSLIILHSFLQQSQSPAFVFSAKLISQLPLLRSELVVEISLKQCPSGLIHASIIIQALLFSRVRLNGPNQLEPLIFLRPNLFEFFRHRPRPLI